MNNIVPFFRKPELCQQIAQRNTHVLRYVFDDIVACEAYGEFAFNLYAGAPYHQREAREGRSGAAQYFMKVVDAALLDYAYHELYTMCELLGE